MSGLPHFCAPAQEAHPCSTFFHVYRDRVGALNERKGNFIRKNKNRLNTYRGRQTERQRERDRGRQTERKRETDRQKHRHIGRQMQRQAHRHAGT